MTRRQYRRAPMRRRLLAIAAVAVLAAILAGLLTAGQPPAKPGPDMLVFAEADTVGTQRWIAYLSAHGFRVHVRYDVYVTLIHQYLRIPQALRSLQTALVDGYIIEGNVPAEDIRRLLAERPHARGLAVPGTPDRAPGMSGLGGKPGPYQVLLFGDDGNPVVFATHGHAAGASAGARIAPDSVEPHAQAFPGDCARSCRPASAISRLDR